MEMVAKVHRDEVALYIIRSGLFFLMQYHSSEGNPEE
jgi:hypothetical protein